MPINKQDLITKQKITSTFNSECVELILNYAGTTYDANNIPKFQGTSYYGTSQGGTVQYTNPNAIPDGQLDSIGRTTMANSDIPDTFVTAKTIYDCMFMLIKSLTHIRPFTSKWIHQANGGVSHGGFTDVKTGYAYFKNIPTTISTSQHGSGTWGKGGNLYKWAKKQGADWTSLEINKSSLPGIYTGEIATAEGINNLIQKCYNTWADNCKGKNGFEYEFYTCHLNCYSAWSAHSNRSRR